MASARAWSIGVKSYRGDANQGKVAFRGSRIAIKQGKVALEWQAQCVKRKGVEYRLA